MTKIHLKSSSTLSLELRGVEISEHNVAVLGATIDVPPLLLPGTRIKVCMARAKSVVPFTF